VRCHSNAAFTACAADTPDHGAGAPQNTRLHPVLQLVTDTELEESPFLSAYFLKA